MEHLDRFVRLERMGVLKLIGLKTSLFCVIDAAQIPAKMFSDCFLSRAEPPEPQPIIHQIVDLWKRKNPSLILSGDGISMQKTEIILDSVAVEWNGPKLETITDIGAFDSEEDQRLPGILPASRFVAYTLRKAAGV